jgi:hypothetical protein
MKKILTFNTLVRACCIIALIIINVRLKNNYIKLNKLAPVDISKSYVNNPSLLSKQVRSIRN